MEHIPEELIILICEHCDHSSLKNTRLVDKRWRAASTPGVFEHFYMGLFGYGLNHLEQLARSPLCKHVKKFTFFADILPSWPKETYQKAIDFRPTLKEFLSSTNDPFVPFGNTIERRRKLIRQYELQPKHELTEEQIEGGFAAYNACLRDQINWRKHNLGLKFREFFSRFPSIQQAYVKCVTPFDGRTNLWPVWKSLREKTLVGPDDWMYSIDWHDDNFAYLSGQAALALLEGVAFRSTFACNTQIATLSIHSPHLDAYRELLDDSIFVSSGPKIQSQRAQLLFEAFRNVTNLHIHVPHATIGARLNGLGMAEEAVEFLTSASQLKKLDLRYGDDELSPDDDSSHLECLFDADGVLWPHIRELSLATNIRATILIKFLRHHALTLRRLDLRDMLIHDVDTALREIPRILILEHIYVECLWDDADGSGSVDYFCVLSRGTDFDDPYEKAVKAYLLCQASQLPEIERDGGLGNGLEEYDDQDIVTIPDEVQASLD